ncbi:ABC transporter permease [Numidum massiliense]|uniref:ABC transporter permease n=1 Tax=Numidum massiliense TaxID=1522315 RepID=UPI0006D5730E|nr:ABC transporter permease [Numidum massiliense]
MTFPQLAFKNVRGDWHKYAAYYLSSAFTVLIFFVYAAFIFHPDVVDGKYHPALRNGLIVCEVIIVIFAFFFTLYSVSAFLKTRQKSFGLFTLMGMTQGQLYKLVFYETAIISLLAIGSGIGAGLLVTKGFFELIESSLDLVDPLPFVIASKAIWITVVGFLVLFTLLTAFALLHVGRSQIIDMIKAARRPKKPPLTSKWLVVVAVLCLAAGYGLAWVSGSMIVFTMFPILILTVIGTYFLFTQGSVAILRAIQKSRRYYYRGTHMLSVSQLVFKLKDNARVLFTVAILSAVVLTATGVLYSFYEGSMAGIKQNTPYTIGFTERGVTKDGAKHKVIAPQEVEKILRDHEVTVTEHVQVTGLAGDVVEQSAKSEGDVEPSFAMVIPNRTYNKLVAHIKEDKLQIASGHAVWINPYVGQGQMGVSQDDLLGAYEVQVGRRPLQLKVDDVRDKAVLNVDGRTTNMLVVSDADYDQLAQGAPQKRHIAFYGYELQNWQQAGVAVEKIEQRIPEKQQEFFQSRIEPYVMAKQIFSLTFFIGAFVSVLFFIAAGSMLYFKLFTELQEDQAQFKALRRIGLTKREVRKIATTQVGLIFFLPFLVGVVHAGFAMKILRDLLGDMVWGYAAVVVGVYFVLQCFYFLLSRSGYLRQMTKGY